MASSSSSDPPSSASTEATTSLTQDSISALEYLTQQEELESSARDVLPYSFQQCTAPLGPLRQAVYSCLTCSPIPPETQHGGICYSCSIQCHGSHNLVELFCKRDFVCDCGNTRMGSAPCSLRKVSQQQPDNKNAYSHNFVGQFCSCDQFYKPEAEEGTMFQCLVCEDWFHEKCIGEGRVPDHDDFDGFVCQTCVGKNEWLGRYVANKATFLSTLEKYPEDKVDIETVEDKSAATNEGAAKSTTVLLETLQPISTAPPESIHSNEPCPPGVKRSLSIDPESMDSPVKRVKLESDPSESCKWEALPPTPPLPFALFLKEDFRNHLCRCINCETLRLRTLPMISHEEETYEPDEDNSDTDSLLDAGTRALSSLPRTQAINGIVAYQRLSTKLKSFFQGFAASGKVVSEADVRGFFAEMQNAAVTDVANGIGPDSRREESAR